MTHRLDDDAVRQLALEHWRRFCDHILPHMVRRIARWRQLPRTMQAELQLELAQELAADCLAQAAQVVVQPPRVRHGRWLRLAERYAYAHYIQPRRRRCAPDELLAPPEPSLVAAPVPAPPLVTLANGRTNVRATAAAAGLDEREARTLLDRLACLLGADAEQHAFWRARLAEALTGLAADLLRQRELVHLLPRPRQPPDPAARLRRLRRLAGRFPIRPTTRHERRILGTLLRRGRLLERASPRHLLESATQLAPFDRASWLWLFEARLGDGDLAGAAVALRSCRLAAAPTVLASTLARARLLEARGRRDHAIGLLQRSARRFPRERMLAALAATLG